MAEPRDLVEQIERSAALPAGAAERFSGYGVMAAPFATGHILCLRRFPASSVGPAYTSIWHKDPNGAWTFFQNAPLAQSCPRYFARALRQALVRDIATDWTGPRAFTVTMSGGNDLRWDVTLAPSPVTGVMNAMGRVIPDPLWRSPAFLKAMGAIAGVALGAGKLAMAGRTPNGQAYVANPLLTWLIPHSRAVLDGQDFGPAGRAGPQVKLGDFWIPARGLFAIGRAFFEPFDATRHAPLPS